MPNPSHRFRKDHKSRKEAAEIAKLAVQIEDQATLDKILADCASPTYRAAVFALLLPHLTFAADCFECGFRRGVVIPHPCSPEAAEASRIKEERLNACV